MADEKNINDDAIAGAAATDEQGAPQAGVVAQYIKDLSFENPNAPASLQNLAGAQPAIDVNVNVGVRKMNDEMYEVELKIIATAKDGEDQVAFVTELAYGTLFGIRGVEEEALRPFLLIQAPLLMFPYARRIISDASRDGGFPPLMLEPINFEALYMQQHQDAEGQAAEANAGEPAPLNLN